MKTRPTRLSADANRMSQNLEQSRMDNGSRLLILRPGSAFAALCIAYMAGIVTQWQLAS